MKLAINEFVVRHRTTGKIWFRCICIIDRENYADIEEANVYNETVEENNLAAEFNDNFSGHQNICYLNDTENFVCGTETTITEHTVAELCAKPKHVYLVFMLENINSEHTACFESKEVAEAEAKIRNTNYANYSKCKAAGTKFVPVNEWSAHLYFHVREIKLI